MLQFYSDTSTHSTYDKHPLCVFKALEWIHDTGEFYLSTHTSTGSSIHHTQELLKEHEEFHITAKVGLANVRTETLC